MVSEMLIYLLSFFLSFVAVYGMRRFCLWKGIMDVPNIRSSHVNPTARIGGVGFIVAYIASLALWGDVSILFCKMLAIAVGVSILSLMDDLKGLKPSIRFLVHILFSVGIFVLGIKLIGISMPFVEMRFATMAFQIVISVFFLAAMTNVYNFMDGIDGYAGGVGILGALSLAGFAQIAGKVAIVDALLMLAAVLAGFWIWNYPKAKIFMGDVGSAFLGFYFGAVILYLTLINADFLLPMLMVFGVFIGDASVTMIRRLINREKIWEAHRSHFYQRLTIIGWSHRRVIWLEFVHMVICCMLAFGYLSVPEAGRLVLISVFLLTFVIKFGYITLLERSGRVLHEAG